MERMKIYLYSTILVSSALQFALSFNLGIIKSEPNQEKFPVATLPKLPASFSDMCGGCGKKHTLRMSAYTKNERNPRRVFENLTKFLSVLSGSRMNFVKRDTQCNDHVVKCLQQNNNSVTCFSRGKFYQFEGDLGTIYGEHTINQNYKKAVHKRKRFCSHCALSRKNRLLPKEPYNSDESILTKKLSSAIHRAVSARRQMPYQEVMMEPSSRKLHPQSCYGFVAPQAAVIYSMKASSRRRNLTDSRPKNLNSSHSDVPSTGQSGVSLVSSPRARSGTNSRRIFPSNYGLSRNGSHRSTSLTHLIAKRSQIVSVACRPLYIPTAKPSVNEGRVPQCRIPCGAHNCGPFPTCPCRPSSRTPAPPPTTCPPIPGLAESEATLTLPTRCSAYNFTDEPCPTFECKDGCPYLTTPGCPSESSNGTGIDSVPQGPPSKMLKDRGEGTRTTKVHLTSTAPIALMGQNPKVSRDEKPPKENPSLIQGKHRMGSFLKSSGSQYIDSRFGSKVPGVWSNFDFKKLLKSAKSHYKEKVESNLRTNRNDA